jgi:hypothetical protein
LVAGWLSDPLATDVAESASGSLQTMPALPHPLRFVLIGLAGWMHRQQRDVFDSRLLRLSQHDRQYPPPTRPGARARAGQEDDVDRVPEDALGRPRRHGLLQRPRLDESRAHSGCRAVRHRPLDAARRDRRDHVGAPDSAWMTQVSRNLTDASDGFLKGKRFLIHDRDPLFTVGSARHSLPQAGRSGACRPIRQISMRTPSASYGPSKNPVWIT